MRLFVALLILAFSLPVAAQEKKAEKKTEKKAEKKTTKKTEKTQAGTKKAEPKQEWGRFSSNAPKDMKALEEKKAR